MCPAFSLQRILRGLAVIPFIVFWMIFPIGVLTGAMTNLNTAVCGGTPGGWQRLRLVGSSLPSSVVAEAGREFVLAVEETAVLP